MRPQPRLQNVILGLFIILIATSLYAFGWPVSQRMEEYVAFVSTSELAHGDLARQSAVFAAWRGGASWSETVQAATGRLKWLLNFTGNDAVPLEEFSSDLEQSANSATQDEAPRE